jgi:putative flavoprotein involved in K+ transport
MPTAYPPVVPDPLPSLTHTVVIGAGHAGLIMSRLLRLAGREHVVLERRSTLGGGWQDRWDAFQLVTPNLLTDLPDHPYDAGDPNGFMTRDEIIARTARYAEVIDAPVAIETEVRRSQRQRGWLGRRALRRRDVSWDDPFCRRDRGYGCVPHSQDP